MKFLLFPVFFFITILNTNAAMCFPDGYEVTDKNNQEKYFNYTLLEDLSKRPLFKTSSVNKSKNGSICSNNKDLPHVTFLSFTFIDIVKIILNAIISIIIFIFPLFILYPINKKQRESKKPYIKLIFANES